MQIVGRELNIRSAGEYVIDIVLVRVPVEIEGHAVGGIACVTEASFK